MLRGMLAVYVVLAVPATSIQQTGRATTNLAQSANTCITVNNNSTAAKMPSTPQMRKANEKNAKNVTKRGQVVKSSKTEDKYPVSPELIVSKLLSY